MTLRLILLRHAKSSWDDPALPDRDRPLNARGRRSADALGRWLADRGLAPDAVICSPSRRTRETWQRVAKSLPAEIPLRVEERLYEAGPDDILDVLKGAPGRSVAIVGHNPAIGALARSILRDPPTHPKFGKYPAGALLVADFDAGGWNDVRSGSGRIHDFIVPRELTD